MRKTLRLASLLLFIFIGVGTHYSYAQDMSNIRVDELSDTQVRNFVNQVQASGLSEAQLEQVAISRGMSTTEVQNLRQRVDKMKLANQKTDSLSTRAQQNLRQPLQDTLNSISFLNPEQVKTEAEKALDELKSKVFGASLFQNADPQFEPNLNLATPKNYVIGTDDEIMIEIYGYSEASYKLTVSPEGNINIPNIGVVSVAGSTIESASTRIRNSLSSIYSGISNGTTNVNITLSNIRSIKVILTGSIVKPGTYTLPSVASAFNALYASGGPTLNGTMRDIRIIRNGQVISTLDVYDFLVDGSLKNNITLQDQDVIFVPPYSKRVELIGQVKRPALFELKAGETFDDLLKYAGGFTEYAYQDRIQVLKNTDKERRIEDLLSSQFNQYEPVSGDKFTISRILERFENRVTINGAVFRPGDYELSPGLTLSMLIKKADGVKEDAFLNLGYITRLKPDLQPEQVTFNVANILAGTDPDIQLKKEDKIFISSIFDLKDEYSVSIDGEIRNPGTYNYAEGRTVKDLILEAGGFKDSATPLRIEVSRRVTDTDITLKNGESAEIFQIDLNKDFEGTNANFLLKPFDMVFIRTAPGYETQKTVRIEGEVLYPGSYAISKKDERITDIIKRAGGFTPFAYIKGASLKRVGTLSLQAGATRDDQIALQMEKEESQQTLQTLTAIQQDQNVALNQGELQQKTKNDYVGINFTKILEKPEDKENLLLHDGDIIFIPKELQTVKVGGDVLSPVTAVYVPNRGLKYYISQAGGFSEQALKKRSYVVYANGSVKSTNNFIGIRTYPQIEPGAEIFVPKKEFRQRQTISPQAWVGIGSTIASMAAVIFSIINSSK
ncbi:SLBB domain-containing protein [Albibacterium bauzanense]|nr:SLBB domain-containing protein [Albibacterium bauzanense]